MRRENLLASLLVLQSTIESTYAATPNHIPWIGPLIEAVVGREYGESTGPSPTTQYTSKEYSASVLDAQEASSPCDSQCTTGMMMSSAMQTYAGVVPAASSTNPTTILGTATSDDPPEPPLRGGSTSASSALLGTAPTVLASDATAVVVHTSSGDYEQNGASASSFLGLSALNTITYPSQTLAGTTPIAQMSDGDRIPTAVIFPTSAEVDPSKSASDSLETTGPRPQTTEPPNALAVLYSALPSDVAASIASELELDTTRFLPSERTSRTTRSTSATTITTLSTSSTSSTFSMITRSSSTTSATASSTATEAPPANTSTSTQLRQGSIAGIATGATAGVVLIILAALLLLRRRQHGKPLFGSIRRSGSQRSNRAYPEVAWLYDPDTTPPQTSENHARGDSGISLLPTAYEGAAGVAGEGAGGRFYNPEARLAGPGSPLLPPQLSCAREESPGSSPTRNSGRGRSARSSLQSVTKMGPIHEEPHFR